MTITRLLTFHVKICANSKNTTIPTQFIFEWNAIFLLQVFYKKPGSQLDELFDATKFAGGLKTLITRFSRRNENNARSALTRNKDATPRLMNLS